LIDDDDDDDDDDDYGGGGGGGGGGGVDVFRFWVRLFGPGCFTVCFCPFMGT